MLIELNKRKKAELSCCKRQAPSTFNFFQSAFKVQHGIMDPFFSALVH